MSDKKERGDPAGAYKTTLERGVKPADPWDSNTDAENEAEDRALEKLADEKHDKEKSEEEDKEK